jgi:hypothetical protein
MTLDQVRQVIGSDGVPVSSVGGDGIVSETWQWKGAIPGSNALCSFTNGRMDVKAQTGL